MAAPNMSSRDLQVKVNVLPGLCYLRLIPAPGLGTLACMYTSDTKPAGQNLLPPDESQTLRLPL